MVVRHIAVSANFGISCGCGIDHTFISTQSGEVYAAGLNKYGQLGTGDTVNRLTFTKVAGV